MMETIIQLVMAGIGSVAFGLIFNVNKKYLAVIFGLGVLCWGTWLYSDSLGKNSIFVTALLAGLVVAIAAEIISRIIKAPSTIFFLTATIPIIPGGQLYHCMQGFITGQKAYAADYGTRTLYVALGISTGMSIAWAVCDLSRKVRRRFKRMNQNKQ